MTPDSLLFFYCKATYTCGASVKQGLNRLKIRTTFQYKGESGTEHEVLIFDVKDTDRFIPDKQLTLERTVRIGEANTADSEANTADANTADSNTADANAPNESTIDNFLRHPDSESILDSFRKFLVPLDTPKVSAVQASVAQATTLILVSSALASASALETVCVAGSALSTRLSKNPAPPLLPRTSSGLLPELSLTDRTSLKAVDLYSNKPNKLENQPVPAVDQFLVANAGCGRGGLYVWHFDPKYLNVFHVALVATIVHEECPFYLLLKHQCYWFANLIFEALWIISGASGHAPKNPSRKETMEIYIPFRTPQGRASGRWRGIKVQAVEDYVLAKVVDKFQKREREELDKVNFESPPD